MKKSTLIAVAVFAGLLVAAVISLKKPAQRGIEKISFASLDIDKIDRVEITGAKPVTLVRAGEEWKLDSGKEADANAVKRLLEALPKVNSHQLVTRNPDRFAELEVDEEKGTAVKVLGAGKVLAEFVIGKSSGGETQVRVGDKVFGVKGVAKYVFAKDASAWHQLKLFKAEMEQVQKVEIKLHGKPAYALVRDDQDWKFADASVVPAGFRFDKNAARALVNSLINTRAAEVLDKDPGVEASGLGGDADVLIFSGKDGVKGELRLGKADDSNKVYVQVAGRDDVYKLAEYSARNLRKAASDLRELTLVKLDTSKVARLSIDDREKKVKLVLEKQGADWKIAKSSAKIPKDFELDPAAVTRRLSSLGNARGLRVASEVNAKAAGLGKPQALVTATLEDKSTVQLKLGASFKDDKRDAVYASGNIDDAIYVLTSYVRNNLTGGLNTFKKRAPAPGGGMPNFDPSALGNLPPDVRASLMKQMQQKQQQQQMMQALQAQAAKTQKGKESKAN